MQHLFGHFAERLTVELLVYQFDIGVFVTLAHGQRSVACVQAGDTALTNLVGILQQVFGLTVAADAAAGAGHDLDEVVLLAAVFHALDQRAGVGRTIDHCDVEFVLADVQSSFADAVVAAYGL